MQTGSDTDQAPEVTWRRRLRGVPQLLAALAALAATLGHIGPAQAQASTANIRLAHFSPDAPEMDVYLVGFDGQEEHILAGLGYGDVSDYASLEPGSYSFLLRPMGAPADSDPAVTASAELEEGATYTFVAMGPMGDMQQALLTDDLSPPPAGDAKVRLLQASSTAGEVDISAVDGPVLAQDRPFTSVTEYAPVPAGEWTVRVTTSNGTELMRQLPLDAGTVNTLVVFEGNGDGPELTSVLDAMGVDVSSDEPMAAEQAMPLGGVATGAGGAADVIVDGSGAGSEAPGGSGIADGDVLAVAGLGLALAVGLLFGGLHVARRRTA
jgi:hypothetical protein